jgi:ABC-type Fe3+/spermidine/putrescine transport system ATPase subunit
MNIIAAQAAAGAVTLPGFGAVPVAPPVILPPGAGTVTCAIRPERLSLAPGGGPAAAARVVSAAFLGDRMHVFCAIDGWPAPVIVSVPGRDAAAVPGPGAAVTVTLDPAHLLVLDDGPAR